MVIFFGEKGEALSTSEHRPFLTVRLRVESVILTLYTSRPSIITEVLLRFLQSVAFNNLYFLGRRKDYAFNFLLL